MESSDHSVRATSRRRGGAALTLWPLLGGLAACAAAPSPVLPRYDGNAPPPQTRGERITVEKFRAGEVLELATRRELRLEGQGLRGGDPARPFELTPVVSEEELRLTAEVRGLSGWLPRSLGVRLESHPEWPYQVEHAGKGALKLTRDNGAVVEREAVIELVGLGPLVTSGGLLLQQGLASFEEREVEPTFLAAILGPNLVCERAALRLIGPATEQDRPVDVFALTVSARSAWVKGSVLTFSGQARYAIDNGRLVSLSLMGSEEVAGTWLVEPRLPMILGLKLAGPPRPDRIAGRLSFFYSLQLASREAIKK